uniref:hypothetical protein n=1 Tax=Paractinoplanes polyasparticus TaxID=2856853 RepID=UPI001C846EF0|nr:hypothetical protein [Actinoplanes polyasparticus]
MDSIVFPSLPTYLFEPSLAGVLSLALTVILPLLAAVLMRSNWSAFKKGLVLLAMAAVKAFLEAWIGAVESAEAFEFLRVAYTVIINFGIAVVFYFGLLRHTDIQQSAINSGVKSKPGA